MKSASLKIESKKNKVINPLTLVTSLQIQGKKSSRARTTSPNAIEFAI